MRGVDLLHRNAEALLFQMLLAQPHNQSDAVHGQTKPAEPKHVRTVAEYLEAHLGRPIQLAELASLTGRSVRSIHEGFQRHRGQSPLAFLRTRRLMAARRLLLRDRDSQHR